MALRAFFHAFFVACVAVALAAGPVCAKGGNPRYAALVMDADTGMILHQSNADRPLHPASLVKMMTLLMTFEAIENGQLHLRDRITVSNHAASMVPSKLGLQPGESIRVEDAIYAVVTKSANDIAVALAERIGGGSERRFATMMNSKARQIGMTQTNFVNASGLHNPRQVTSARDMARLARYILTDHPRYYHYFSTRQFSYKGLTHRNHNRLMETYKGMDGFKTGYVTASGFNLVASARRGNARLIGVVFGGMSANSRNAHMKTLLDSGFAQMKSGVLMAHAAPSSRAAVPLPDRKPSLQQQSVLMAAAATAAETAPSAGYAVPHGTAFEELIGEGDYDPAVSKRLETGMMAVAAVKGQYSAVRPPSEDLWAVQVGAFGSRARTDNAIAEALQALPAELAGEVSPAIAPLRTNEGWLFRGRLTGLTKEQAEQICSILSACLPVAPQTF